MKSVIIHADGRHINLAGMVTPEVYAELENTRSPRDKPVLWCGGCKGPLYVRHGTRRKDTLFGAHHQAGTCPETLAIHKTAPMSDEHKRQAEYHALAAERAGHSADFEVTTGTRTRVDVVIDSRIGIEVQRSAITKAAAAGRTARSVAAGLETVAWFTDRTSSPQWIGHVPGYRATVTAAAWMTLPPLGTVTVAGPRIAEAVQCGTRGPCPHRQKPCTRWVPWFDAWTGLLADDVVTGLAEGTIRPVILGKNVLLTNNRTIALYAELTGRKLAPYDPGQPKPRIPGPSPEQQCDRPYPSDTTADAAQTLMPERPDAQARRDEGAPAICIRCHRQPRSRHTYSLCDECDRAVNELVATLRPASTLPADAEPDQ